MLHFPINDKCNLVSFPSRQILSLEHHSHCLQTCARQHKAGLLSALYIWSVQTNELPVKKILISCTFSVCELLLSGTAAKKDAVCLASRDPNQLHVQDSRPVNASKTLNKCSEDSSRLVSFIGNFWGTQIWESTWTMKQTLETCDL